MLGAWSWGYARRSTPTAACSFEPNGNIQEPDAFPAAGAGNQFRDENKTIPEDLSSSLSIFCLVNMWNKTAPIVACVPDHTLHSP